MQLEKLSINRRRQYLKVSIPQAVSTVATIDVVFNREVTMSYVSIPQAVSTVATVTLNGLYVDHKAVSIPQAVSTVATKLKKTKIKIERINLFQYRKR